MIIAKSKSDLEKMRAVGELIAGVREALRGMVQPGVTTMELNNAAEKMIRDAGAYPTFLGYQGYPYSICASTAPTPTRSTAPSNPCPRSPA